MSSNCFKIVSRPDVGRCLVATRDILPTELIMLEDPAALGPCQNTAPRCLTCLMALADVPEEDIVYCEKCNFPFCSVKCSTSKLHINNECSVFPYR